MNYVKSLAKQLGAQGRPREWSCAWADLEVVGGQRAALAELHSEKLDPE